MTSHHLHDSRTVKSCLAFSLLAHLVFAFPLDFFKSFKLAPPVMQSQTIMVDLQETVVMSQIKQFSPPPTAVVSSTVDSATQADAGDEQQAAVPAERPKAGQTEIETATPLPAKEMATPSSKEVLPEPDVGRDEGRNRKLSTTQRQNALAGPPLPPLRRAGEFLATEREKLSYRISMIGILVGNAELEAMQDKGEVRITLRIQSNSAISSLYPVDDFVETRHIGGNYIITRIRLKEGISRSDKGFTLFLRDKSVFWIDLIKKGSMRETIPNSEVVDILSGLYFLRNRPLQVGTSETLHVYDSDTYAAVPVEVLRRERIALPGFRHIETLVLQPHLKTEGILRRTGDILIWVTDDENRVPVRVETTIALGRVAAELTSSEVQRVGTVESAK